jgi:hypothetical protein
MRSLSTRLLLSPEKRGRRVTWRLRAMNRPRLPVAGPTGHSSGRRSAHLAHGRHRRRASSPMRSVRRSRHMSGRRRPLGHAGSSGPGRVAKRWPTLTMSSPRCSTTVGGRTMSTARGKAASCRSASGVAGVRRALSKSGFGTRGLTLWSSVRRPRLASQACCNLAASLSVGRGPNGPDRASPVRARRPGAVAGVRLGDAKRRPIRPRNRRRPARP